MSSEQIVAPSQEQTKRCSKCTEIKPLSEFSAHKIRKDGKRSHCKKCAKIYWSEQSESISKKRRKKVQFTDEGKVCWACKEFKLYSEFYKDKARHDGYCSDCKECKSKRDKQYHAEHTTFTASKHSANKNRRTREIKALYDEAYKLQKGLCAICGNSETSRNRHGVKRLSFDHCHETGRLRGLLCGQCNFGLGQFKDDPILLQNAISYLQKS